VHVISQRHLRTFWQRHARAEVPLRAWHQIAQHATWKSHAELLQTHPSADVVQRLTVFNIGGNDFRLIARVEYERQEIYIRSVLTHAEDDKGDWKNDPWFRRG
jgi:mRNA interferase HigB